MQILKKQNLYFDVIVALWLLISVPIVWSQPAGKATGYRLGEEDAVKLTIFAGGENQVVKEMIIGDNGVLNVPFIGKVKAAGLTLEELEKAILVPLAKDYFVNPEVHLQIVGYHSLQFFISGAIGSPGMFEMEFTPTIMDLIVKAGGVKSERGNIAYVLRSPEGKILSDSEIGQNISKGKPLQVDLKKLLDEGDMSENIRLKPGDTIYIPPRATLDPATTKVYIQGLVRNAGVYDYQPGLTALKACIIAGGFDKFAAPNRAKVIRQTESGQEILKINLDDVQKGKAPDLPLQPGDRILIPESWL